MDLAVGLNSLRDQYAPIADLVGRDRHKIDNERFCHSLEKANRTDELCWGLIKDHNQAHTTAFKCVRKPYATERSVGRSFLPGRPARRRQPNWQSPYPEGACQNLLFELLRIHAMQISRVTENLCDYGATGLAIRSQLDFDNARPTRGFDCNQICSIATE